MTDYQKIIEDAEKLAEMYRPLRDKSRAELKMLKTIHDLADASKSLLELSRDAYKKGYTKGKADAVKAPEKEAGDE